MERGTDDPPSAGSAPVVTPPERSSGAPQARASYRRRFRPPDGPRPPGSRRVPDSRPPRSVEHSDLPVDVHPVGEDARGPHAGFADDERIRTFDDGCWNARHQDAAGCRGQSGVQTLVSDDPTDQASAVKTATGSSTLSGYPVRAPCPRPGARSGECRHAAPVSGRHGGATRVSARTASRQGVPTGLRPRPRATSVRRGRPAPAWAARTGSRSSRGPSPGR